MSKTIVRPTLSPGNHIYLYRLLRDAIGCGKQTFMTQIEEALAAGDMTAYELGFESTRELLEELDDCIKRRPRQTGANRFRFAPVVQVGYL